MIFTKSLKNVIKFSVCSSRAAKNCIFCKKCKKLKMPKVRFLTEMDVTMSFVAKNYAFWYRRTWFSSHGDPFREDFCVFVNFLKNKKIKISKNHQKSWFWAKWRSPWAPGRKIDVEWIQNFWFSSHGDPFHAYFCVFYNFSLLKQITQVAYSLNEEFLEKLSCYLAICGRPRVAYSLNEEFPAVPWPISFFSET